MVACCIAVLGGRVFLEDDVGVRKMVGNSTLVAFAGRMDSCDHTYPL